MNTHTSNSGLDAGEASASKPKPSAESKDRESLMLKIVEAGQRAGIIRKDLETASVVDCLHILECLAPLDSKGPQPGQGSNPLQQAVSQPCWEISTAHICEDANVWLNQHSDADTDQAEGIVGCGIEVSSFYHGYVIKLFSTPWTDENLKPQGISAEDMLNSQRSAGMPESLVCLLGFAAQAQARFLVLDADADVIEGLPVYDW